MIKKNEYKNDIRDISGDISELSFVEQSTILLETINLLLIIGFNVANREIITLIFIMNWKHIWEMDGNDSDGNHVHIEKNVK